MSVCAAALCLASAPALAQLQQQTGVADPGRITDQIRENLVIPQLSPDVQIQGMELLGAPAGSDDIRFTFGGLEIEGNNIYSTEQLSPIYRDKIGQEITLTELYRIANQITLKYRNDGYILTQVVVPPQTIESGVTRLQVVEGFVHNINIQADGEGKFATALIHSYAAQIKNGDRALNIRDMERQLLLINDLPGVTARTIISPAADVAGAADVLIIVERDTFDALVTTDNFGSRFLGQWAVSGVTNFNSLLGLNELISVQAVYAPGSGYELLYGGVGYEQPIGNAGTRAGVRASITDTEPGHGLEDFEVRGRGNLYSAYVSHPFLRSRNENLKGTLAFDWRDIESRNNVETTREDNIRALRADMQYDFLDTLFGVAVNGLNVRLSQGMNAFGASEEGDANLTRADGDPQFTKAEVQVQRLQRLTNSVNLQVTAKGQLASDALPSSEEMGVGGVYSGRGYDPSEIVGDHGVAGQVELQWNNSVEGKFVDRYQLYTFFDAGRVWNEDATTSDDKDNSLTSTGFGTRLNLAYDVQAGVGVAFPLTRRVESEDDRDPRLYLNLSKKF